MLVLYLGYEDNRLIKFLSKTNRLVVTSSKLKYLDFLKINPDLIVSYGYRYILRPKVVKRFKIINLHVSYLPWNRGAYPNLWSIIDDTPKGVTIHLIDKGIDTGPILFQKELKFNDNYTLCKSYYKLREEIEQLFMDNWTKIVSGDYVEHKQEPLYGTFHKVKETEKYLKLIDNWDMTISEFKEKSRSIKVPMFKRAKL